MDDVHIAEGVAPAGVAAAGAVIAAAGVGVGLKSMRDEQIPRAALMSAVIFVSSSLIRLPIGPSSVHPILNGLAGLVLGWASAPVFLVSLFLQALLFQFGGITTLGINTLTMGIPAVICYYLYNRSLRRPGGRRKAFLLGAAAGVTASMISFFLWAGALMLCGRQLSVVVGVVFLPHLVIVAAEGIFTGLVAGFLARVYPEIFEVSGFNRGRGA